MTRFEAPLATSKRDRDRVPTLLVLCDVKPTTKSRKAACTASAVGSWKDITLEGEDDEDGVAVFDECGEIRRKIRLLLKEPDFKRRILEKKKKTAKRESNEAEYGPNGIPLRDARGVWIMGR
ncbi:hypothetical protein BKA62DRAFT_765308 [Auriculariales sp. MPI-PUGE-AT-0066]|nr:hypothetical protein BKA62DRAFT_765308 [Auriculariales sp. MPI-PUGE-AT-0066]